MDQSKRDLRMRLYAPSLLFGELDMQTRYDYFCANWSPADGLEQDQRIIVATVPKWAKIDE